MAGSVVLVFDKQDATVWIEDHGGRSELHCARSIGSRSGVIPEYWRMPAAPD